MVGFFLYLCSIDLLPHYFLALLVVFVLIKNRKQVKPNKLNKQYFINLLIILIVTALSFFNSVIHWSYLRSLSNIFPYTSLMFGSLIIAKYITLKDIKVFIILTCFEAFVCIFEAKLGVNTLFTWKEYYENYNILTDESFKFLYFRATNGLSSNSSVIAEKILISILLLYFFKPLSKKYHIILEIVLLIGLVLSFQRTSLAVLCIFYILYFTKNYVNIKNINRALFKANNKIILFILIVIIGLVFVLAKITSISNQFTRGTGKMQLSGREVIWPQYVKFIDENIIFGDYSQKHLIKYRNSEEPNAHAHNSYLQVLANHGIIIFVFFVLLILVNIKSNNWVYITSLLILSLFQYSLFWGISILDIVFFCFAIKKNNNGK